MRGLRASAPALGLAVTAWASGCATRPPMIEPAFAARTYTPIRIAVLPPDVFVIYDQVGDNDPRLSSELSARAAAELTRAATAILQSRGYEVNLTSRWDGITDGTGNLLVGAGEMGWLASSFLQFANSAAGGGEGPMKVPAFVAPELCSRVGWATASDALLYANVKGVTTSNGKRAAQIFGAVFIVLVVVAVVLAMASSQRGGGGSGVPSSGSRASSGGTPGWSGSAVGRAGSRVAPGGGPGPTPPLGAAPAPGGARWIPPAGRGARPGGGGPVYGGGPHVGIGVGFWVPVDGPEYTHDGAVGQEDETFNGDEIYVSLTLVNAADGRVLWHVRDEVDLDAEDARDVDLLAQRFLGRLPLRGGLPEKQ